MTIDQSISADSSLQPTALEAPVPAPLPVKVLLEHLNNVTLEDAREYAMGYLKNKATSATLFYGLFAHGNGYIVEIHEGGAGAAFTPELIRCLNTGVLTKEPGLLQAQLTTGKGKLFVSLSKSGLSAMTMPELSEVPYDLDAQPSDEKLEQVIFNHSGRVLRAAVHLFMASAGLFFLAMCFKPDPAQITVSPVQAEKLPLSQWVNQAHWPANEKPVTARLNKATGELDIRTEKLTALASLKDSKGAQPTSAETSHSDPVALNSTSERAVAPAGASQ